jgi:hypothetical protein
MSSKVISNVQTPVDAEALVNCTLLVRDSSPMADHCWRTDFVKLDKKTPPVLDICEISQKLLELRESPEDQLESSLMVLRLIHLGLGTHSESKNSQLAKISHTFLRPVGLCGCISFERTSDELTLSPSPCSETVRTHLALCC